MNPNGYIMTNNHVVSGASDVEIFTQDRKSQTREHAQPELIDQQKLPSRVSTVPANKPATPDTGGYPEPNWLP